MRYVQSLDYIRTIVDRGSIRSAAESCAITPSALNRHIQALEAELGFSVFDRKPSGVALSHEGEVFYQFAVQQIASFDQMKSKIADLSGERVGKIRIGVSLDLDTSFLHQLIYDYRKNNPGVTFRITRIPRDLMVGLVRSNQIDLVVSYDVSMNRHLRVLHATEAQIKVIVPEKLTDQLPKTLTLDDLKDIPLVAPLAKTGLGRRLSGLYETALAAKKIAIECDNPFHYIANVGLEHVGFCVSFGAGNVPKSGAHDLRGFNAPDMNGGNVSLITAANFIPTYAMKRFIDRLIWQMES